MARNKNIPRVIIEAIHKRINEKKSLKIILMFLFVKCPVSLIHSRRKMRGLSDDTNITKEYLKKAMIKIKNRGLKEKARYRYTRVNKAIDLIGCLNPDKMVRNSNRSYLQRVKAQAAKPYKHIPEIKKEYM